MLNPVNNELLINNKRIELWSSTVNGISAWNLNFNSNDANMYFNARANGFSLRCH